MSTGSFNYELKANASGFTSEVQKAERSVEGLDKAQGKAAKSSEMWTAAAKKTAIGIAAIGAAGALVLRKVIQNTSEQDRVMAQLNATLKSTGGISGKTSEELAKTAAALQGITTYGDEAIISAQSLLLTFKNIKGDNFDRTTKAVLDLSTAMGTDLKSAAIQLGKALNDPDTQLSALSRSGITFSESQKEMVKAMVAAGDMAGAQTMILKELESQFGGSAEAARNTLGGALESLGNSWGDLFEVQADASQGITDSVNALNSTISDPAFKQSMDTLIQGLINVVDYAAKASAAIVWMYQTIAGTRKDTLVDLYEDIDKVSKSLGAMEKAGRGNSMAAQKQRARLKELQKQFDEMAKSINKGSTSTKSNTATVKENAAAVETQATALYDADAAMQKMADTSKVVEARLKYATTVINNTHKELDELALAHEEQEKASEQAAQESARQWESARDTLSGFFFEMAADGKNAFDTLVDGFKAMIAKMLAEAAANSILLAVGVGASGTAAASGGASGAAGSAGGSGGGSFGSLLSTGSSLYGAFSGGVSSAGTSGYYTANSLGLDAYGFASTGQSAIQSLGGAGLDTGTNFAVGSALNIGAGLIGSYAGSQVFKNENSTGLGATAGGIIGSYWGPVGTAIGSFLGEGFEKVVGKAFGYKQGGNNAGGGQFDFSSGSFDSETFSLFGKNGGANLESAKDLADVLYGFSNSIGGSTAAGGLSVGSKDGIKYNGQKFKDTDSFFQQAFRDIIKNATALNDGVKPLIISFKGAAEELGRFAAAISSIDQQAGINTVTNAIEAFAEVQPTALEAYADNTAVLLRQIQAFDGSLEAAERLNATLYNNKIAAFEFTMAIQGLGRTLNDMTRGQSAYFQESVLTDQELLDKRIGQRDFLRAGLAQQTDPQKVGEITQSILTLNKQIFDAIAEDQQLAYSENFAAIAEEANQTAQAILGKSVEGLENLQGNINDRVSTMLQNASAGLQRAADTQQSAANTFMEAVQTFGSRAGSEIG